MISLRNGFDGLRRNASIEQPKYAEAREAGDTEVAAVIVGEAVDLVHTEENCELHRLADFVRTRKRCRGARAGS